MKTSTSLGLLIPLPAQLVLLPRCAARPMTAFDLPHIEIETPPIEVDLPGPEIDQFRSSIEHWWHGVEDGATSLGHDFGHTIEPAVDAVGVELDNFAHTVENAANAVAKEIDGVQAKFPDVRETIERLVDAVQTTVDGAAQLRLAMNNDEVSDAAGDEASKEALHQANVLEVVEQAVGLAMQAVFDAAMAEIATPLEGAPTHETRLRAVAAMVGNATDAVLGVLVDLGADEAQTKEVLGHIAGAILDIVVLVGDLQEQHPVLFETAVFIVVAAVIPEDWLLSRLLEIMGFGLLGPVKGSAAAWMQREFYGATIQEASWFARLQSAGMKVPRVTPIMV
ncbi:hypothetical protein EV715DRAFT_263833 [Schizophyllum commune]